MLNVVVVVVVVLFHPYYPVALPKTPFPRGPTLLRSGVCNKRDRHVAAHKFEKHKTQEQGYTLHATCE